MKRAGRLMLKEMQSAETFHYLLARERAADHTKFVAKFVEEVFLPRFHSHHGEWRALFVSTVDAESFLEDLRESSFLTLEAITYRYLSKDAVDADSFNRALADELEALSELE